MTLPRTGHSERYGGRYLDGRGSEAIEIVNDHTTLRTSIRGMDFAGRDFDGLAPLGDEMAVRAAGFTFADGHLCACEIRWQMSIVLGTAREDEVAQLAAHLILGKPTPTGGIDREDLQLRLVSSHAVIDSVGTSGWFEDELLDIQRKLPADVYLRACIGCGLSDYSPYGHGLFGSLACFRTAKPAYRAVSSKQDLFAIWNSSTEYVQETYLCPEFERRRPGTGYRG